MPKKDKLHKEANKSNYFDFFSSQRLIFISGGIESPLAKRTINQILYLEYLSKTKAITLLINSPGGEIQSGFAMYDIIKAVKCPINTVVCGLAASMASVLSLTADKGKRFIFPNAKIMIHQPLIGGYAAPATDLQIQTVEIMKTKKLIAEIYANATGKKIETIVKDIERDFWLSADDAKKYGLVDKIITKLEDI